MKFGDPKNPLLLSIRSGARASMPGMMDTVLNLGLNSATVKGLADLTGNEWFAWDCYRRFVAMYGDVVLGLKPESKEEEDPFEDIIDEKKKARGIKLDIEFTVDDLKDLVAEFKAAIKTEAERRLPRRPGRTALGRHRSGLQVLDERRGPSPTGSSTTSRPPGALRSTYSPWSSATSARIPAQASPSPGIRQPVRTSSTVSIFLTPRAKTWSPARERPLPINKKQKTDPSIQCLEEEMPEAYKQLLRDPLDPREPFQGHAGRRVHHPAQEALDAPDKDRQENGLRRVQDRRRHGEGGAHRQGRGA